MPSPILAAILVLAAQPPVLPEVRVEHAGTAIDKSCRVVIEPDAIIEDTDGRGVIIATADDITIEFADGSVLRGAGPDVADDLLVGAGVRIEGRKGVTLRNARIEGFKSAVYATRAAGLTIDHAEIGRNFRQRLRSTPRSEDQADWLWPHQNDDNQWLARYGAGVYVEDSDGVTLREITVRRSQNGIVLDRVNDGRVYDNDCSFLSGWGLAMWRSSRNTVSRNAMDFCIRGYSHGVYNRGQDSAGILVFEQCSDNHFIENSATHGGDGFFLFAGKEALGEGEGDAGLDRQGLGCNRNVLRGNDFSFAAAHGVESTFSFDNWIIGNRIAGNAICGVWGGYSQRTVIAQNSIEGNGSFGAREGGGINIEHGFRNEVWGNRFSENSIDIALWDDDDAGLMKLPWAEANHKGSRDNFIGANEWSRTRQNLRLRRTPLTHIAADALPAIKDAIDADTDSRVEASATDGVSVPPAAVDALGERRPVGARRELDGRENIFVGEWGPWDHKSGMLRLCSRDGSRDQYELFGDVGPIALIGLDGAGDVGAQFGEPMDGAPRSLTVGTRPGVIGVRGYEFRVQGGSFDQIVRGTLIAANWAVRIFPWDEASDPRTSLEAWRRQGATDKAVAFSVDSLGGWMNFGSRGPREVAFLGEYHDRLPGPTRYGLIARTKLSVPAGKWRFKTLSDDGVRITVAGQAVIENWTLHAPETNQGLYAQSQAGEVEIVVEYFQIEGHAAFDLEITAVGQ
ncbi:MAG: right-handed parallel beta-helix repeat-containing protein [Phycisphaerales bacterium]|nr:right-handed parallel beta-helix repeat-containing protein [Phycisphaerales bacterium]